MKVAKQMTENPARMSKEEYFTMLDRAEQGPSHAMLPGEDLTAYLHRRGYDVITPALRQKINKARKEDARGETIICRNKEELQQFFDSL